MSQRSGFQAPPSPLNAEYHVQCAKVARIGVWCFVGDSYMEVRMETKGKPCVDGQGNPWWQRVSSLCKVQVRVTKPEMPVACMEERHASHVWRAGLHHQQREPMGSQRRQWTRSMFFSAVLCCGIGYWTWGLYMIRKWSIVELQPSFFWTFYLETVSHSAFQTSLKLSWSSDKPKICKPPVSATGEACFIALCHQAQQDPEKNRKADLKKRNASSGSKGRA